MAKPIAIDADHLGAAIDGLATTNAMLFTILASPAQSDAALQLLDRLAGADVPDDPLKLRSWVAEVTARTIRALQESQGAQGRTDGAGG